MSFVVDKVTFGYDGVRVLEKLSLTLPAGETIMVLGPNGVGKSTLLALLGLLWEDRLQEGQITYNDDAGLPHALYGDIPEEKRIAFRRGEFGIATGTLGLLPHLSCADNLLLPLLLCGSASFSEAVDIQRKLAETAFGGELERHMNNLPRALSTGQKSQMSALRALIHDPRVLLLDEPFANLDGSRQTMLRDLLDLWKHGGLPGQRKRRDRILFLITHPIPEDFLEMTDRVVILQGPGRKCELVRKDELPADPALARKELERLRDKECSSCK